MADREEGRRTNVENSGRGVLLLQHRVEGAAVHLGEGGRWRGAASSRREVKRLEGRVRGGGEGLRGCNLMRDGTHILTILNRLDGGSRTAKRALSGGERRGEKGRRVVSRAHEVLATLRGALLPPFSHSYEEVCPQS